MKAKELSLKEKIGQMVMIGMDTNYITDRIKNMIINYKIGGVILYRKNFCKNSVIFSTLDIFPFVLWSEREIFHSVSSGYGRR